MSTEHREHDFTKSRWGHSLESFSPGRFITISTPLVVPGDVVKYETHDGRVVRYRVLDEVYKGGGDPHDMAIFTAEKVENDE